MKKSTIIPLSTMGILLLMLIMVPFARATPPDASLESLVTKLDALEKEDPNGVVKKDVEMARSFLNEVRSTSGGEQKRLLTRAELSLVLVDALVTAAKISAAADSQEAAAYEAPETMKKIKAEIVKLSKQRDALLLKIQALENK